MAALSVRAVAVSELSPGSTAPMWNQKLSSIENSGPALCRMSIVGSIGEDSKGSTVSVRARSRECSRRLISFRARVRGRDASCILSHHHPGALHKRSRPLTFTLQRKQGIQFKLRGRVHATKDDEIADQDGPVASPPSPPSPTPLSGKKAAEKAEAEKGQRTAIITGVISVLLGVGYLVLIQLLDTRGVSLIPPPPEAYDP